MTESSAPPPQDSPPPASRTSPWYYRRGLLTPIRMLELRVLRDRHGRFSTDLFPPHHRPNKALPEMYVQRPSTRKVHPDRRGATRSHPPRRAPSASQRDPRRHPAGRCITEPDHLRRDPRLPNSTHPTPRSPLASSGIARQGFRSWPPTSTPIRASERPKRPHPRALTDLQVPGRDQT